MQLTWAGNYKAYGDYRRLPAYSGTYIERLTPSQLRITATSTHYLSNPKDGGTEIKWSPGYDPDIVAEQPYEACDSGGFYWVSKSTAEGLNLNRFTDKPYSVENVGKVNRFVNGGGNGYYERQAYSGYLMRYLTDITYTDEEIQIDLPSPKAKVLINFSKIK